MKHFRTTLLLLSVLAVGCLTAQMAHADGIPVTLTFPGIPGPYVSWGGQYVSPYPVTLTQGGTAYPNTQVICDQINAITYVPGTYNYEVYNGYTASNKTGGTQDQYDAAAYLSNMLITGNYSGLDSVSNFSSYSSADQRGIVAFAIWDIFVPHDSLSEYSGVPGMGVPLSYLDTVASAAMGATAGVTNVPDFAVLVPDDANAQPNGTVPQEFILIKTPESSAMALLVTYLTGLAGLVFVFRRKLARL